MSKSIVLNEKGEKLATLIDYKDDKKLIIYNGVMKHPNGLRFHLVEQKEEDAQYEIIKTKQLQP